MTGKATDDADQDAGGDDDQDAGSDDDQLADDHKDEQLANKTTKRKGKQASRPATRAKVVVEDVHNDDEVEDEEDEEDQNARLEVEPAEAEYIDRCIDESEEWHRKRLNSATTTSKK